MANLDLNLEIAELAKTLAAIEEVLKLPELMVEVDQLEKEASDPDLWNDTERAQSITSQLSRKQALLNKLTTIRRRIDDLPLMIEMAEEEKNLRSEEHTSELQSH